MSAGDKLFAKQLADEARLEEQVQRMLARHASVPIRVSVGPVWLLPGGKTHPRQRYRRSWGARW